MCMLMWKLWRQYTMHVVNSSFEFSPTRKLSPTDFYFRKNIVTKKFSQKIFLHKLGSRRYHAHKTQCQQDTYWPYRVTSKMYSEKKNKLFTQVFKWLLTTNTKANTTLLTGMSQHSGLSLDDDNRMNIIYFLRINDKHKKQRLLYFYSGNSL